MKIEAKIDKVLAIKKIEKKDSILSIKKKVETIELLCIPYYLYQAEVYTNKGKISQLICIDCANGDHAFIKLPKQNYSKNFVNKNSFSINESEALKYAKNAFRNDLMLKKRNSFNPNEIKIYLIGIIEYPFWIGYYKRKTGVDFEAIDALNGKKQGAKMKSVFVQNIMQ